MSNLQLSASEVAVDHSPDFQGVGVSQFPREGGIGKILVTDRTGKANDGLRTDRSGAAVGARGIGSAVNHGVTNLKTRGIAVENDAADLVFQDLEQFGEILEVSLGAVNRGGEMAAETSSGVQKVLWAGEMNQ